MTDPVQTAVAALFATLRDRLPARLRAADAERFAVVQCSPGPYLLPAGELQLNGQAVAIVEGEYSAAQLATLIDAAEVPDLDAFTSDDGETLVLEALTGPVAKRPSQIRVEAGPIVGALGLPRVNGRADAYAIALGASPVSLVRRTLRAGDGITTPTIGIDFARASPVMPLSQGLHLVSVRLVVVFPGWPQAEESTVEATVSFTGHIVALIAEGDGRGPFLVGGDSPDGRAIVKCIPKGFVPDWNPRPVGNAAAAIPFGSATLDLEIEVFDVGQ